MPSHKTQKSKLLLLIPILFVIGVSGCTTSTAGGGPGVVVLGWEPDLSQVFSDDKVNFILKVQNQGDADARNVIAEITNLDTSEWGTFGFNTVQLGTLIQHDPTSNTPGETATTQFSNLRAPLLPRGTSFMYNPIVRITYDYSTTAQKPITIVDKDELVRIKQQGQTLPGRPATYTSGPLAVDIIMGDFVKSTRQISGGLLGTYDIIPVQIIIRNTLWGSGGTVIPRGIGSGAFFTDFDYPINVKINPPAGTNFVFSGYGDDCSEFSVTVDMFRGEQAEVTCELEVTNPPTIRTESLLQVEIDYRYAIDAVTQLNVQGTEEIGGFIF